MDSDMPAIDDDDAWRQMGRDSFNAAGLAMTGGFGVGLAGGMVDNALGSAGALQKSSKTANLYDFPDLPQRPFEADYPNVSGPIGEPLTHTMDGVPLRSQIVAGRQESGGNDVALGPREIRDLAARLADNVRPALAGEIGKDAGRYFRVAGADGPETSILYRSDLSDEARPRVLAHEIGHSIDDKAGNIPVEGLVKPLRANYNTGTNANRGRVPNKDLGDAAAWAKPEGTEHPVQAKKDPGRQTHRGLPLPLQGGSGTSNSQVRR